MNPEEHENEVVLSIFPGIDVLGMAFERQGFCVVRGPDPITGGDIRDFRAVSGCFAGVIGGPPCQDFSRLNRRPGRYGYEMLEEYGRIVVEADPDWFLMENVVEVPDFEIPGYVQQRFPLDLAWFSDFSRRRDFVYGCKDGRLLDPIVKARDSSRLLGSAVTCGDNRSFRECCDIQGLPRDFDLPSFSLKGKKKAVGNAVPMALGLYVAQLIWELRSGSAAPIGASELFPEYDRVCACGCGRRPLGRKRYSSAACRKRAQRARDRGRSAVSSSF